MRTFVTSITLSATVAALGLAAGLLLGSTTPSGAGNASLTPRPPVVRDHRTKPAVRDHRRLVRDHRGGKVPGSDSTHHERGVPCLGNLC